MYAFWEVMKDTPRSSAENMTGVIGYTQILEGSRICVAIFFGFEMWSLIDMVNVQLKALFGSWLKDHSNMLPLDFRKKIP